jgi:hypothetical protein
LPAPAGNAEREHQDATQGNVSLAERVLEHVDFTARSGRVDDEEPEKRAEADHQDGGVDRELRPAHFDGRGPDHERDGDAQEWVEREVENVGRSGEGVAVVQPGVNADADADEVERDCRRQAGPRCA